MWTLCRLSCPSLTFHSFFADVLSYLGGRYARSYLPFYIYLGLHLAEMFDIYIVAFWGNILGNIGLEK